MLKEKLLKANLIRNNKKIVIIFLLNAILFLALWMIPIHKLDNFNLCIFHNLTGKRCWNCGMTHAFLSILHLRFKDAYMYNHNVIIVFPLIVFLYLKYMFYDLIKKDI